MRGEQEKVGAVLTSAPEPDLRLSALSPNLRRLPAASVCRFPFWFLVLPVFLQPSSLCQAYPSTSGVCCRLRCDFTVSRTLVPYTAAQQKFSPLAQDYEYQNGA